MPTAIGIDLGTTYCCIAIFQDDGTIEVISDESGNRKIPSCVAFTREDDEVLVGEVAKNNRNAIYDIKRIIGRKYEELSAIHKIDDNCAYRICNDYGRATLYIESIDKSLSAEEITAIILKYLLNIAQKALKVEIIDAVITVPGYFSDAQRQATRDAAKIAGFNVLKIINEPTAVALSYAFKSQQIKIDDNFILICDIGGGTFDVSIGTVDIDNGLIELKAISGDTHLGGSDFDDNLVDYLTTEFQRKYRVNIKRNKCALSRLKSAAEAAKRALSLNTEAAIEVEALFENIDFTSKITRAKFDEINSNLYRRIIKIIDGVICDAKIDRSMISEVILSGGTTRIPRIQNILRNYYNFEIISDLDVDESVAYGAAIQAAILTGRNPLNSLVLSDITPLSLGIETAGGIMTRIIERNTRIPCNFSKIFTTSSNHQDIVKVQVFEGERDLTRHDNLLGSFDLGRITKSPRGVPTIEVNFDIDADGILNVSAVDTKTGFKEEITITNREDGSIIDKILHDSRRFHVEDRAEKERIEARNNLEAYAYQIKNTVDGALSRNLGDNDRDSLRKLCNECLLWIDQNLDAKKEEFEKKDRLLGELCRPVFEKLGDLLKQQ